MHAATGMQHSAGQEQRVEHNVGRSQESSVYSNTAQGPELKLSPRCNPQQTQCIPLGATDQPGKTNQSSGNVSQDIECSSGECEYTEVDDVIWENHQSQNVIIDDSSYLSTNSALYNEIGQENSSHESVLGVCSGITEITLGTVSGEITEQRKHSWPRLTPAANKIKQLKVYEACRIAATHNLMGPRIPLQSGIKIEAWKKYSTGHIDEFWLLQCIEYGYPMQYRGPSLHNDITDNHSSATNFMSHVQKYIQKESGLGGLIGPFSQPPFRPWCHVAPIMSRPKTGSEDRRIIVDLSYPPNSNPNMYIEKNLVFGQSQIHALPTVQDAIRLITSYGFNVMLGSLDISRAYRNFRLDPYDWPLSCIQVNGQFFIDICMPFGSRLSSLYMQRMSNMITRALANMGVTCLIYLDDALVICPKDRDPEQDFNIALRLVRELGLPLAWEKLISPTLAIRFLGVIIDVENREVRIPKEKCDNFLALLAQVSSKKWITKRTLQQIIGHINHLGKGVEAARLFMNRLLSVLRSSEKGTWVDDNIRKDLDWFGQFLHQFNGRSIILGETPARVIEADSCLSGGGAVMGPACYSYVYPAEMAADMHISQLEAWNCLIAVRHFLSDVRDECVEILCDNHPAICSLNSGRGRDPVLLAICRAFWFFGAARNIKFVFSHVPGVHMTIADALSRCHLSPGDAARAEHIIRSNALKCTEVDPAICDFSSYF